MQAHPSSRQENVARFVSTHPLQSVLLVTKHRARGSKGGTYGRIPPTLTCTPPTKSAAPKYFTFNGCPSVTWNVSDFNKMVKTMRASACARRMPRQLRAPTPNGTYAPLGSWFWRARPFSVHRDGRNACPREGGREGGRGGGRNGHFISVNSRHCW